MLELGRVQSGHGADQRSGRTGDEGIAVIGAHGLAGYLVIVELYLEGLLHVANRTSGANKEIVGTNLDYLQIFGTEEALDGRGFSGGGGKRSLERGKGDPGAGGGGGGADDGDVAGRW